MATKDSTGELRSSRLRGDSSSGESAQSAATAGAQTQPSMPGFAWRLNDAQVADVLTYIRGNFGGAGAVSAGTVQGIRGNLSRK